MTALDGRTEGWIAALQLAALSMQGRDDVERVHRRASPATTATSWTTSARRSSPASRRTSASSCSGRRSSSDSPARSATPSPDGDDGKATLVALERANLFVVPLDDRRQWYRYHHLFADVLRAHLLDEHARARWPSCTARASAWFEADGDTPAGDQPRPGRRRRRPRRRPHGTRHAEDAPGPAGGRARPLGARCCPTTWCGAGRCSASASSRRWPQVSDFATVGRAAVGHRALPARGRTAAGPSSHRRISSSSTTTATGHCPPRSTLYRAALDLAARGPRRHGHARAGGDGAGPAGRRPHPRLGERPGRASRR